MGAIYVYSYDIAIDARGEQMLDRAVAGGVM